MRLIIVRHGETEENVKKITQGQLPGTISELGKEQIRKLANRLKNEKFSIVYSSDLKRCVDTLDEIIKFHPNIPIKYTDLLREKFAGPFQGKANGEYWKQIKNDPHKAKELGFETYEHVYQRMKIFLHEILKKHSKETILVVAHGATNRMLLALIMNMNSKEGLDKIKPSHNTSVNIIDLEENGNHKIHLINCIKHLD
ncbi:MAG: histidine phosphatase family protein [Candidatus Aenigmarchaeota archaeon]|nr:histidine phosphatase family protein [Candidatus Aenigmarchaeota archaeon]